MNDIDIVVNNAGILDERRWEREIAVNIVSDEMKKFYFSFVAYFVVSFFLLRSLKIKEENKLGRNGLYGVAGCKIPEPGPAWTRWNFSERRSTY